jgi:hypothetical protein
MTKLEIIGFALTGLAFFSEAAGMWRWLAEVVRGVLA